MYIKAPSVMSDLTLVSHHLCPFVQRAVIALREKGVGFHRLYIDLNAKPDWFKEVSPLGKVPLLIVKQPGMEDAVLFESAVICEYLEETQPGPAMHPADPVERARHRAWIEFASAILGDIYALETTADATLFATKCRTVTDKFARIEDVLDGGPFFAGDRFSLVDAAFGPVFRYFDVFDRIADFSILADKPKIATWRRILAIYDSVQGAVEPDYEDRLWRFLEAQPSYLRSLMRPVEPDLLSSVS